jgi:hypothetical protein
MILNLNRGVRMTFAIGFRFPRIFLIPSPKSLNPLEILFGAFRQSLDISIPIAFKAREDNPNLSPR